MLKRRRDGRTAPVNDRPWMKLPMRDPETGHFNIVIETMQDSRQAQA